MRLFFLTTLTMFAFAANSVLTRMALADAAIGPASFALVRLMSGAVVLAALVWRQDRRVFDLSEVSFGSVLGLSAYVLGFSYAYMSLETGTGALILFGGVQVTMFAGALIAHERPSASRWIGAVIAFAGLAYLLAPSVSAPDLLGAVLMAGAAVGWGYYSLYGRTVGRPLQATAANFLAATPIAALVFVAHGDPVAPALGGFVLAGISGAVTSGIGYALWYAVLPKLDASLAAVAQLTVPVIALGGGVLFVGEALSLSFAISAALVLGGVAVSLRR